MSYPYLKENPAHGSSVSTALFNWLIIGVFMYVAGPSIVKIFKVDDLIIPEKTIEERMEELNITVNQPTVENQRIYSIDPVIVITPTPMPIDEEDGYDYYSFGYSYYFPDLGGVNCHTDNWNEVSGKCADTTASGKSWKQNLYRGVALHYDQLFDLPFGTIIQVLSPEEIKGYYEVIDICPGCNPRSKGGHYFIDFLDDKQRLPWGEIVKIRVRR